MGLVYVDNVKYYKRKGEHVFSYRYRVSNDSVGWSKVTKSFDSFDSCRDFVYGFLDYEVFPVPYSFYAKLIGLSGGKTVKMTKMGGLEEVVSCGFGKLKKKKKFLKDGEVERVLPDKYQ